MLNVPATMTAIEISDKGGPEVLVPTKRNVPEPGPGQVLVKVAAAGVNRPDVQQRLGAYPPPPDHSPLPGLEIAGEVLFGAGLDFGAVLAEGVAKGGLLVDAFAEVVEEDTDFAEVLGVGDEEVDAGPVEVG